ncbi:hypothetical protein K2X96_00215 [Patescibacteria group bacterium]|nr:hypothetical protein [Patescibacteria group bacterium]
MASLATLVRSGLAGVGLRRRALLGATATHPPKTLGPDDRRALAVTALRAHSGHQFKTLPAIEFMTDDAIRAFSTAGTVLEPVVAALNAAGVATEPTIGAVMDNMGLDREQLHHGLCHCIHGETISGHRAAENFAKFA